MSSERIRGTPCSNFYHFIFGKKILNLATVLLRRHTCLAQLSPSSATAVSLLKVGGSIWALANHETANINSIVKTNNWVFFCFVFFKTISSLHLLIIEWCHGVHIWAPVIGPNFLCWNSWRRGRPTSVLQRVVWFWFQFIATWVWHQKTDVGFKKKKKKKRRLNRVNK